jgi:hypothetical protein
MVTATKAIVAHSARDDRRTTGTSKEALMLCEVGVCEVSCATSRFYQLRTAMHLRIPPEMRDAETALVYLASDFQVSITLSGLSEIELMP